jgi:hypothetical protein
MARSPFLYARCGVGIKSGFTQLGEFMHGYFRHSLSSGKGHSQGTGCSTRGFSP